MRDEREDERDVERDVERDDAPSADDVERVTAALRTLSPPGAATGEPDWAKLAADVGAAVDGEVRRRRRVRAWTLGGAVLAAAAVAALIVWPAPRARDAREGARAAVPVEAAPAVDTPAPGDGLDDLLAEELHAPDDLGGMTLDDELIDEAAATLDRDLLEQEDALDDRLLPDGAWLDELSDEELELAVAILEREAG